MGRGMLFRSSVAAATSLVVMAGGLTSASAADADWKAAIGRIPGTAYTVDAQGLTATAASAVAQPDTVGKARSDALKTHANGTFFDGSRVVDAAHGKDLLQDLQQYASWSSSRLGANPAASDVAGLVAALTATRQLADAAIQDAAAALRTPPSAVSATADPTSEAALRSQVDGGSDLVGAVDVDPDTTKAALADLAKAREFLAKGDDADRKGLPVTAAVHDGQAWRFAYGALAQLGITYGGDRDRDGVIDVVELRIGSSPLVKDTDGDGLLDSTELNMLGWLSASKADSDGDGVPDGSEDLDGDTLTNLAEARSTTSPTNPDTDGDGVRDDREAGLGTSPTRQDTDGDTLLDGVEGPMGTSPVNADTDGDGVRDDAEVLSTSVTAVDGVRVVLTGRGDLASGFRSTRANGVDTTVGQRGQVGPAYSFELAPSARSGLAQATLTMPYDPARAAGHESDLRVFWFDTEYQLWRPAASDQRVDTSAHTVTATVSHFSLYAVFDITNWKETWSAGTDPCRRRSGGGSDVVLLDLSLILDSSGSMSWNDPSGLRRTAAKSFVDALLPEDRAAVVDFDYWATVLQPLTTDKAAVKAAIDQVDDSGGTDIAAGVEAGTDLLIANGDDSRGRMAILLTDGEGYYDDSLTQRAKDNGIVIYTIGLGTSVDTALLTDIATRTGGTFHQVLTPEELPEVFRRLSEETGDDPETKLDTDDDGLDDCTEKKGALGTTGDTYVTDANDADTDDDGIPDGKELALVVPWDDLPIRHPEIPDVDAPTTYTVYSDPTLADTDGDGVDDGREGDLDTFARWVDSDFDGLSDGAEIDDYVTSPIDPNSDGDAWDDSYELSHAGDGLDPQRPDTTTSKWDYVTQFVKGYVCGDFCQDDTIAWFSGYLSASGTSFVPVVGWIVGAVTDLRDTIANAIHGDWISSGVSLVGVVPYVGDAGAIAGKVVKFVGRVPKHFDDVVRMIAGWDKMPSAGRNLVLKAMLGSAHADLKAAGFSDDAITLLAKAERTDLRALAAATRSPLYRAGAAIPFKSGAKAGEDAIRSLLGDVSTKAERQFGRDVLPGGRSYREYDAIESAGGGKVIGHEVKTGSPKYGNEVSQCERDGAILASGATDLAGVVWHFVGHSRYGSLSVSPALLSCLSKHSIPFEIHAP